MDKTLKEEAAYEVSEMYSLLNSLRGMFLSLQCSEKSTNNSREGKDKLV
jgi:hypothetical protein